MTPQQPLADGSLNPSQQNELESALGKMSGEQRKKGEALLETLIDLRSDFLTQSAGLVVVDPSLQGNFPATKEIVENVQRLLAAEHFDNLTDKVTALHHVLVSMSKDIRIIVVASALKAVQLEQMDYKTAKAEEKVMAKETLDIYAPLLHKLGMAKLKNRIEDGAFRVLEPVDYQEITQQLEETKKDREVYLQQLKTELENELKIIPHAQVAGRVKHIYSIWKKMKKKEYGLDQLQDLVALRVLVDTVPECYMAIGLIHSIWDPLPGRFKDYIAKPKENGYQSLHTTVMGPGNKMVEIQIRTQDMHQYNEVGMASHAAYKGHTAGSQKQDQRLMWLHEALKFQQGDAQLLETLSVEFFENEIFVFTPKGDVIELPEGSTPVDFAFAVHSGVGMHCIGAKINGKSVPLHHRLQNADRVEIQTSEKSNPKRHWLSFVQSSKAKSKIRTFLQMQPREAKKKEEQKPPLPAPIKTIQITGHDQHEVKLAKCCRPVPGDEISAFLTTKRKIAIHRSDCAEAQKSLEKNRIVKADWNTKGKGLFEVAIRIQGKDDPNLLSQLLLVFSRESISIKKAVARKENQFAICEFEVEIKDQAQLQRTIEKLSKHPLVRSVERA